MGSVYYIQKVMTEGLLNKHPIIGIFGLVENDQVSTHCSSLISSRKKDDEIGEGKRGRGYHLTVVC